MDLECKHVSRPEINAPCGAVASEAPPRGVSAPHYAVVTPASRRSADPTVDVILSAVCEPVEEVRHSLQTEPEEGRRSSVLRGVLAATEGYNT